MNLKTKMTNRERLAELVANPLKRNTITTFDISRSQTLGAHEVQADPFLKDKVLSNADIAVRDAAARDAAPRRTTGLQVEEWNFTKNRAAQIHAEAHRAASVADELRRNPALAEELQKIERGSQPEAR